MTFPRKDVHTYNGTLCLMFLIFSIVVSLKSKFCISTAGKHYGNCQNWPLLNLEKRPELKRGSPSFHKGSLLKLSLQSLEHAQHIIYVCTKKLKLQTFYGVCPSNCRIEHEWTSTYTTKFPCFMLIALTYLKSQLESKSRFFLFYSCMDPTIHSIQFIQYILSLQRG